MTSPIKGLIGGRAGAGHQARSTNSLAFKKAKRRRASAGPCLSRTANSSLHHSQQTRDDHVSGDRIVAV